LLQDQLWFPVALTVFHCDKEAMDVPNDPLSESRVIKVDQLPLVVSLSPVHVPRCSCAAMPNIVSPLFTDTVGADGALVEPVNPVVSQPTN
jgi:hypothetical protein